MLSVTGRSETCCDGVRRRHFLKAGALGLAGISLADVLALRAHAENDSTKSDATRDAARNSKHKSVIFIELAGGADESGSLQLHVAT